jgi:pyruvate-ferredoxin/flavodoxin oxidoreductase
MGEVRYSSLVKNFPDDAAKLFAEAEEEAKEKYRIYKKMAEDNV